jgi:hypothetical protein
MKQIQAAMKETAERKAEVDKLQSRCTKDEIAIQERKQ